MYIYIHILFLLTKVLYLMEYIPADTSEGQLLTSPDVRW